jgi:hypothetical protein
MSAESASLEISVATSPSFGIASKGQTPIPGIRLRTDTHRQHLPGCGFLLVPLFHCPHCGARAVMTRGEVFALMESEELIAMRYRHRAQS